MESEVAFILGVIAGGDIRREAPTPPPAVCENAETHAIWITLMITGPWA